MCSSAQPGDDREAVLATGVNGSIFWTSLSKSGAELFADDDVEEVGFVMPAVMTPEEQASGSQVKTRAKMSSRHPEYFAAARGSVIHIVAPETVKNKDYRNAKSHKINSEKYLAEHGLRIAMGKACKDFCFSEDDTVIVSLDKSGRFKFWDIKDLTSRASDITEGRHDLIELQEPIWSSTGCDIRQQSRGEALRVVDYVPRQRPPDVKRHCTPVHAHWLQAEPHSTALGPWSREGRSRNPSPA